MKSSRLTLALVAVALIAASSASAQTIGGIETPAPGGPYAGIIPVGGFVLSHDRVTRVELFVDGSYVATANKQIPRADLLEQYPEYSDPDNSRPGFLTSFNSNRFSNGGHTLFVRVYHSGVGNVFTDLGHRSIGIDNSINQAPFGWVDHPAGDNEEGLNGAYQVHGWALDDQGVARVDILVDNLVYGSARLGAARADVQVTYPDAPGSATAGWGYFLDTTRIQNGVHEVSIRVWDNLGASTVLARHTVQIFNVGSNTAPFGEIEYPLRDKEMFGNNCSTTFGEYDDDNSVYRIVGYVLDVGTRTDTGGVGYVELLLDNVIIKSSRIDCGWLPRIQEYANCYGLPRLDVQTVYPGYQDVPNAGFVFAIDPGYYLSNGWLPGHHWLRIRAGDIEETSRIIAEIPVTWTCSEDVDAAAIGNIDAPRNNSMGNGTYHVYGWAIDENGIASIGIYVDGVFAGNASFGHYRGDVAYEYPEIGASSFSGWSFDLDTTRYGDGRHDIVVRVVDLYGRASIIGERRLITDNNNP